MASAKRIKHLINKIADGKSSEEKRHHAMETLLGMVLEANRHHEGLCTLPLFKKLPNIVLGIANDQNERDSFKRLTIIYSSKILSQAMCTKTKTGENIFARVFRMATRGARPDIDVGPAIAVFKQIEQDDKFPNDIRLAATDADEKMFCATAWAHKTYPRLIT